MDQFPAGASSSESKNVHFKVKVPGKGHASPIVVGNRIFVVSAIPAKQAKVAASGEESRGVAADHALDFVVLALSADNGSELWRRTAVTSQPHEGTHTDGTWASASPVSDGERLFAFFGSRGLFAYDLDGKLQWSRDLGDMRTRNGFGEGASPALSRELVLVNWDHEDASFLVALDKKTGEPRWRVARDEPTSWSSPLVLEQASPPQVVVAASNHTRGYSLETGEELWQVSGMTLNVVPTPIFGHGHVYVTSGFRGAAVQAIQLAGARGDLAGTEAMTWSRDADTPYVPSPVLYGDQLYYLKGNNAILTSVDAKTGTSIFGPVRVDGVQGAYASLVAADDRIYVVGRNGATAVLQHGPELEVLAVNTLDDSFAASPALVGDTLYLRGTEHLYAIAETPAAPAPKASADDAEKPAASKQ